MNTFTSIRYSQDITGHVFRTVDTIRDYFYTTDGGYVPPTVIRTQTTEIFETSEDWSDALGEIAELAYSLAEAYAEGH